MAASMELNPDPLSVVACGASNQRVLPVGVLWEFREQLLTAADPDCLEIVPLWREVGECPVLHDMVSVMRELTISCHTCRRGHQPKEPRLSMA